MELTPRRRAVLAALIAFPVGWLYIDIGWRLAAGIILGALGGGSSQVGCATGGLPYLVGALNGCGTSGYRVAFAVVELIIGTVLAGVIVAGLARWVSWPLRSMTVAIDQLGPTNLGLRLRRGGPARDESRQLGQAIDRMLDRVANGYEAQRRFAANASHELRTPLATQRALIEVSLSSTLTGEQLDLLTRQLLATNERNERLIDGLLTLAETERGVMSSGPVRLDLLAAEVSDRLRPASNRPALSVEVEPVTVTGEQALLERLVVNLVQNAIKYNEPTGFVRVCVRPVGELVVSNSGAVVPADQVEALFEPFRRLRGERLDHGGGVGLGLTIARSIVAAHGGTINARPEPGGGLTVTTRFPR